MISFVVACTLAGYTIVEGPVLHPYTATYTSTVGVINVTEEYRWDPGVIWHEIGHHFWFECDASDHPYWVGKPERFANAWAEYRLGYEIQHFPVPWIDAYWMRLWHRDRSFAWK